MTVTIRTAQPADLAALGRMGAALMRTHYEFDRLRFLAPGEDTEEGYAAFLKCVLQSADGVIFVAQESGGNGDEVVGYVYAALEPLSWKELRGPAGFVHDLLVIQPGRRAGVAKQLMQAAVAWLQERGTPRVVLWTAASNIPAHTLFASLGFRDTMIEMTMELDE